jgi:hypothetical protein
MLLAELKSGSNRVTPAQTNWKWMVRAAGARGEIWLPSHFRDGIVDTAIAAVAVSRFQTPSPQT